MLTLIPFILLNRISIKKKYIGAKIYHKRMGKVLIVDDESKYDYYKALGFDHIFNKPKKVKVDDPTTEG